MKARRTALGTTLFQELEKLRAAKGGISMEDAGAVVERLLKSRDSSMIHKELARIIKDIGDAKNEMLALSENRHTNKRALSEASLQLNTVIKSTEDATNSFMDEAELIRKLADGLGGEKEQALKDACTRICEACSFQDLAGQRITKVIRLVKTLETHIVNLLQLFDVEDESAENKAAEDENLLNGPPLPGNAITQENVDALLKSLRFGE